MAYSEDVVVAAVVPTIQKFCYIANLLGINATAAYNTVAGLTPPAGYSYGRYYDSGDPLDQYALFAGSFDDLVNQGVALRETLTTTLQALVQTAAEDDITTALSPAVYGAFQALVNCFASPSDTMAAMTVLAGFTAPPINAGTDGVGQAITSLAARVAVLVRVAALINLGAATAQYVPTSQNDAITVRNTISELIDREMALVSGWFDDLDWQALDAVRLAVIADMNARGSQLEPVITITLPSNLPASVIAYQLYANSEMADDLISRNNPVFPGLFPLTIECLAP